MIQCGLGLILAQRKMNRATPYTKVDLAVATGLSRGIIFNLANNKTARYDAHVLDALCRVLDVQVGDILTYTPDLDSDET